MLVFIGSSLARATPQPATPSSPAEFRITLAPVRPVDDDTLMIAGGMLETRLAVFEIRSEAGAADGHIVLWMPADADRRMPAALLATGRVSMAVPPAGMEPPPAGAPAPWPDFIGPDGFDPSATLLGSDPTTGGRIVEIGLDRLAAERFAAFTRANVGRSIAIVVDGRVVTAPIINQEISDGRVQISDAADPDPAQQASLVGYIRSGPLPVQLLQVAAE
jgi:hypothetical protein